MASKFHDWRCLLLKMKTDSEREMNIVTDEEITSKGINFHSLGHCIDSQKNVINVIIVLIILLANQRYDTIHN